MEEAGVAWVQDKIVALILIVVGLAVAGFLGLGVMGGQIEVTGFAAGFVLFVLPFFAVAAYMLVKSFSEGKQMDYLAKEQRVLDAIRSRGKTSFSEVARASGLSEPDAKAALEGLVGKNLFHGSINWKTGEIFSQEAGALASGRKCPGCGAQMEITGKGLVKCEYCGTEIFA